MPKTQDIEKPGKYLTYILERICIGKSMVRCQEDGFKMKKNFCWTIRGFKIIGKEFASKKELRQIKSIGKEIGAVGAEFFESKRGVEGYLIMKDGTKIPISLKEYITPTFKNVFRRIKDNGEQIFDESFEDPNIKVGENPNSKIYAEVPYTEAEVRAGIEGANTNQLPPGNVYEKVYIRTSEGKIVECPTQTDYPSKGTPKGQKSRAQVNQTSSSTPNSTDVN